MYETKFCKFCGEKIPFDAVICTKCGRQVEKLESTQTGNIVFNNNNNINNSNTNENINNNNSFNANVGVGGNAKVYNGRMRNKWTALGLCIFGGYIGLHKFYEGKIGMGILYLCTAGFFCIGWLVDIFSLLDKPNPYYVK